MSLKETIDADIKTAMKARDQGALRALRAIKSAILLAETSEGAGEGGLTPEIELQLLTKQMKQRKDSIEQFVNNNREDLAAGEREELTVIERYLPKQLTEDEIREELKAILIETDSKTPKDLGKVMKAATARFAGRADGKLVSALAKAALENVA